MPGEFDFIAWVRSQQKVTDLVRVPAGDDLAVLNWEAKDLLLVGVDQVLDGRHFDSDKHAPEAIGRKVMNRNLSDCAAMGCLPAAAVISVALPKDAGLDYAQQLYRGIKDAADPWYCAIVGGDTGSWDGKLCVSVTIMGRVPGVDKGASYGPGGQGVKYQPVTRGGAQVGDGIYVTGPLGGSILGRHMTFTPRIQYGRQLATYRPTGSPCVKAMLDLSDGLSRDLRHLLAPSSEHGQLGAAIEPDKVPVHADAMELAKTSGKTPLFHALHDGEDYELLFTSPVRTPVGIRIGTVTEGPEVLLGTEPLEAQGWEHRL